MLFSLINTTNIFSFVTRLILVAALSLLNFKSFGQGTFVLKERVDRKITDSLFQSLKGEINQAEKVRIYKQLTWMYRNVNLDSSLLYADKGIAIAKKEGMHEELVDLTRFKGVAYYQFKYLKLASDFNLQSLELALKFSYRQGEAFAYDRKGVLGIYNKDLNEGLINVLKAKAIFEETNHLDGIAYANSHLNWIYRQKKLVIALDYGFNVLNIRIKQKKEREVQNAMYDIATTYHILGDNNKAKTFLYTSIYMAKKLNEQLSLSEFYMYLGEVYLSEGNRDSAFFYTDKSSAISKEVKFQEVSLKSSFNLYTIYKQSGDFKMAYQYLKEHNSIKDSIWAETERRDIEQYEIRYEHNKEQQLIRQKQNKILVVFIAAIIAILIIAIISFIRRRRLNKANLLLKAKNNEIERQKVEMEQQTEIFEEMNQVKNKLFSIVSNDIRTPLDLTASFLESLEKESITEKDFQKLLPDLGNHLKNTSSILNNLLLWAKGQMTGNLLNKTAFDLSFLLQSNVDYILSFAKTKGIQITCVLYHENMVYADKSLVDIVCRNLLTSAVKFCNSGDAIKVSTEREGDFVKVIIEDTGTGVSEAKINAIFNGRFFSNNGDLNEAGWGLGLMLSKEFVEKNGGVIAMKSDMNNGTAFNFTIPVLDVG